MFARISLLAISLTCLEPRIALAQFDNRGGVFAPLLMLFGGGQTRREEPARYRDDISTSRHIPQVNVRPRVTREVEQVEVQSERALGSRAFCVRLCDGFYFPVGPTTSGRSAQAQAAACSQMCPAAQVALYALPNGGEVAEAVSPSGQRYASLETAYHFRTNLSASCTCNGRIGGGLAPINIGDDFTMRRGDLVAGETGPLLFNGGGRPPFKTSQFTPLPSNSRQIGREMMLRFVRPASGPRSGIDPTDSHQPSVIATAEPPPRGAIRIIPLVASAAR
jgi:hypothetical protein